MDEDEFDKLAEYLQEKVLEEERKIYSERVINEFMHPQNVGKIENPDSWSRVTGERHDKGHKIHHRRLRPHNRVQQLPNQDS
ncbi:MAG: hypothetical protein ACTSP1_08670 [Candidatus Freyarchaeota archaeon]